MNDTEHPEFCEAYAVWRNNGLTPLTAINGSAELLRRGAFGSLTDPQQQAIATILLNTQQAMHGEYVQLVAALCYLIYPVDQLHECTNRAPHIHVHALPDQTLHFNMISSLSPQTKVAHAERWLQSPGTFLQTAALIIQRHSGHIGVK